MDQNRFTTKSGATYAFREQPSCSGCAFDTKNGCTRTDDAPCSPTFRPDKRSGIWVRIGIDPVAADLAPRESLLEHIADLTTERDELRAANATLHEQVHDWHRKAVETRDERDELAARLGRQAEALCSELKAAHDALLRQRAEADAMRRERDALAARLTEIEQAEPVAWCEHEFQGTGPRYLHFERRPSGPRDDVVAPVWTALIARPAPAAAPEQHPDDTAVDRFSFAMKHKLAAARAKGRGGWDDPEQCSVEMLARMLVEHVAKGDPVDVANFALMLHQRGADAAVLAAAAAPERAAPADGCGACGDACESRGSCRLADESPTPSGWKVVPVEPTPEMIDAADSVNWYNGDTQASVINMWQCMLAAAPEPTACQRAGGAA